MLPMKHTRKDLIAKAVVLGRSEKRKCNVESREQRPMKRTKNLRKQQVFRFLDLPGELRNRIYECAFALTYQAFPMSTFDRSRSCIRRKALLLPGKNHLGRPIPFLGFVQSCQQIRAEFRTWWMSAHQIPLGEFAIKSYFSTYFPSSGRRCKFLKQSNSRPDPAGRLRVFVSNIWHETAVDLTTLIRHKLRYPQFVISIETGPSDDGYAQTIAELVEHDHPAWRRLMQANAVTQVRCNFYHGFLPRLHLVFKNKYAEDWMKPYINEQIDDWRGKSSGFLASVGIDKALFGEISYGVDYT